MTFLGFLFFSLKSPEAKFELPRQRRAGWDSAPPAH